MRTIGAVLYRSPKSVLARAKILSIKVGTEPAPTRGNLKTAELAARTEARAEEKRTAAKQAMAERATADAAVHENRERLKAERLAREAAADKAKMK